MKRIIGFESSIGIQCKILRANMFVMMIEERLLPSLWNKTVEGARRMDIAFDEVAEEDDDDVLNSNSSIDIDDDIKVVSFKDYDKSLDEIDNDTVH
jgi:hypothetical protein